MRRLLDLRIVRWELKLAYVVGVWLAGFLIAALFDVVHAPWFVALPLQSAVTVTGVLFGARIFRGKDEPIEPPRPWWQMTARPTLSRRLGILFVVLAVFGLPYLVMSLIGIVTSLTPFEWLDVVAFNALLAYLYLNSAARLKRLGVPPREPVFKPKKLKLR